MYDCIVVGGGVAGLSAGLFTARAELDTLVVSAGESILARNASLENYPGLPAGFDARRYLSIVRDQAEATGCTVVDDRIESVGLTGETAGDQDRVVRLAGVDDDYEARRVVAASWPDSEYLVGTEVERIQRGSKYVVSVGRAGRTAVDGIYAAGRIADTPHQAIVAAGHGATVGLAVVQDSDTPFYHDWVAPQGYFTGRDRNVPPACDEIEADERLAHDERARTRLAQDLEEPFDDEPTQHPRVADE
ncbi:thioredoxin reductase [Halovivax ruber XH-70]|uniref:Thioredoxin reductase n=1 Tax=Halovivax ruber (strain DSM 18193 / JCM 13892 / XH-70) TaxID=797302 RepID=L0I7X5_HALRX|nr:FAD-binding protein [Halovivax ruber]AGB15700.1 thioredoxin reductase [Halovivax ruber XH-70]